MNASKNKRFRRPAFFHVLGVIFFLILLVGFLGSILEEIKKKGGCAPSVSQPVNFHV